MENDMWNEELNTPSSLPLHIAMALGVLTPVAEYLFGMDFIHVYLWGGDGMLVDSGLCFATLAAVMLGFFAYDIMVVYGATGRCAGSLILFLLVKPAYPLYRQSLFEKPLAGYLIYFLLTEILTAVINVRIVTLIAMEFL